MPTVTDIQGVELRVGQLVEVQNPAHLMPPLTFDTMQKKMVGRRYKISQLLPERNLVGFEGQNFGIPPRAVQVVCVGLRGLVERYQGR